MAKLRSFIIRWQGAILIFLVSILAYGLLIPWLGLYNDDWTFNWTYQLFGSQGLHAYFVNHRPFWGLLYQLTMPIIGDNVLLWHLFGLFWRIAASFAFYWLVSLLWPKRKWLCLTAGLLFAVYPGFLLQTLPLTFGHIWVIYAVFLASLAFTVKAVHQPVLRLRYTLVAVALSLINILCMEYFLPLEVVRWVILFFLVGGDGLWKKVWASFKIWTPYFIILLAVTLWRAFFYKDQTRIYSLDLITTLKQNTRSGLAMLGHSLASGLYQSAINAWIHPFIEIVQRFSSTALHSYMAIVFVVVFVYLVCFITVFFLGRKNDIGKPERTGKDFSIWCISAAALLLAGIPFYVTNLQIGIEIFPSRFTLPFIFGVSLLLAGLLELVPWRWLKVGLVSLLVAGAIGTHLFNAYDFRWQKLENAEMMNELYWRAPQLKPGTLVVSNEINEIYTHSALKAELNLVYPHESNMKFGWIYARDLQLINPNPLTDDSVINIPSFVQDYSGTGNDIVVFVYSPGSCLRFVDKDSTYIPQDILEGGYQNISHASNLISGSASTAGLDNSLLGPEPAHGWCYYFEKSDLALQLKDYAAIQKYYQQVTEKSITPSNEFEWYPFIKGLGMTGDTEEALKLSKAIFEGKNDNSTYLPYVCQIWDQIGTKTQAADAVTNAKAELGCK